MKIKPGDIVSIYRSPEKIIIFGPLKIESSIDGDCVITRFSQNVETYRRESEG